MTLKNASIGVASLAIALSPTLAQANPASHGKPADTHGKGATQRSESGAQHAGGADSHGTTNHGEARPDKGRCSPHEIAYVASGVLASDALTKSERGDTYSGQITVEVIHTNRHARAAAGEAETYTLHEARVSGPIPVDALTKGDRVKLIGTITSIAPKCESGNFTSTTTITKLVFHAPTTATSTTSTP
jgi:hypothetical protein